MSDLKSTQTAEILNSVYRNAQMAYESTGDVLRHCVGGKLSRELTAEQQRYKNVASRAKQELSRLGVPAEPVPAYAKKMAKMGIAMKTARNSGSANIAKIMYKGTTMGIADIQHTVNRTHCADRSVRASAEKLLAREQEFCDGLRRYL